MLPESLLVFFVKNFIYEKVEHEKVLPRTQQV